MGCLSRPQGIFPTQGSNPGLPHCRPILYQLSHKLLPFTIVSLLCCISFCFPAKWISYTYSYVPYFFLISFPFRSPQSTEWVPKIFSSCSLVICFIYSINGVSGMNWETVVLHLMVEESQSPLATLVFQRPWVCLPLNWERPQPLENQSAWLNFSSLKKKHKNFPFFLFWNP